MPDQSCRSACSGEPLLMVAIAWGCQLSVVYLSLNIQGDPTGAAATPSGSLPAAQGPTWTEAAPVACLHWLEGSVLAVTLADARGSTVLLRDRGELPVCAWAGICVGRLSCAQVWCVKPSLAGHHVPRGPHVMLLTKPLLSAGETCMDVGSASASLY